jgi:hypothetical protein
LASAESSSHASTNSTAWACLSNIKEQAPPKSVDNSVKGSRNNHCKRKKRPFGSGPICRSRPFAIFSARGRGTTPALHCLCQRRPDARGNRTRARGSRKHPGDHNTLDDLCGRYDVDRSHRSKHGALFGAELLAAVYVELTCARQSALHLQLLALATSNIQNAAPPIAAAGDR